MAIVSLEMANEIISKLQKENRELREENMGLRETLKAIKAHVYRIE